MPSYRHMERYDPGKRFQERLMGIGLAELAFGAASIGLELIDVVIYQRSSKVAADSPVGWTMPGVWCGALVFLTGIFSMAIWKRPKRWKVVISIILAFASLLCSAYAFYFEGEFAIYIGNAVDGRFKPMVLTHGLLIVFSFGQIIVMLVHVLFSIRAACCE